MHVKRLRIITGFVALGCILLLSKVFSPQQIEATIGEGLEMTEGQPLNIRAESLTYFSEHNLFVAEGSVEITYRTARLTADRVEFNEVTGDAVAIGNVVYEEEGETLVADQMELNIDSRLGIVHRGELSLAEDQYITGQEIEKIGGNTYLIRKGSYTACSSSHPAWKFRSSWAKVHQGEYLQAWNTVGYVQGIPIFYFPYFIFPIKTERQTGVLVPEIGRSSSNGFTISDSFFWAISKSQDLTLTHTYYEKR
jgi:LPS-assembly protein